MPHRAAPCRPGPELGVPGRADLFSDLSWAYPCRAPCLDFPEGGTPRHAHHVIGRACAYAQGALGMPGRARAVPRAWGVRHGAAQGGTDIKSKSINNGMGTI